MFSKRNHRSFSPAVPWWAQENAAPRSASAKFKAEKPVSSYKPRKEVTTILGKAITESTEFYDNFDQTNDEQDGNEDELLSWIRQDPTRGVLLVHRPEGTFSDLVRCTQKTPADTIMSKCLTKQLYVVYGGHFVKKLSAADFPLKIQSEYLRMLGFSDEQRIQEEGRHPELAQLIKFVTGFEADSDLDNKVYISAVLKVKEGTWLGVYSRRFCVLCCTRLYVYKVSAGGSPHNKPSYSLTLSEIAVTNHPSNKHHYCIRLKSSMDKEPEVVLAFDSLLQQSQWVNRIKKLMTRPLKTVHLNACGLEEIPKYLFLDTTIHTLHLTKNNFTARLASLNESDHTWLTDLKVFTHLTQLSLRDNKLESFPISVCSLASLTDLNMSCNRIKEIPPEIGRLESLLILQMQSNLLTNLPYHMRNLHTLMTLSISFNRLTEIPHVVKELRLLKVLLAAGNMISEIPSDINKLQMLEEFDVRHNNINVSLPHTLQGLKNLKVLHVNRNALSNIDTSLIQSVRKLDCSCNDMETLCIGNSAASTILAHKNNLTMIVVGGNPANLTVLDLSRNGLTEIPPDLCNFQSLQNLDLSHNLLSSLPDRIFSCKSLRILSASHNQLSKLPTARTESDLEQLLVHCNMLAKFPLSITSQANKLQVLNISSNKFVQLPALPSKLTELYATDNKLSQIDFISHCSDLKVVHLAYNKISSISASFFISFKQLDTLELAGNRLVNFPVSIGACQKLQALYLNSNKLTELPTLQRNLSLKTLDISHNQLHSMQQTWIPKKLNDLDVSGNASLSSNIGTISRNLRSVSHIVFEGKAGKSKAPRVMLGGIPVHGKWSYGSSHAPGYGSLVKCTAQVKDDTLSGGQDSTFAIIDDNGSSDASHVLQTLLSSTLSEELQRSTDDNELLYLEHTFLILHRELGDVGQQAGTSLLLCRLMTNANNDCVLHVANTGLCEAVLFRDGEVMQLTSPHTANTNKDEWQRIIQLGGFITKDGMVNATSKSSRLIGCYQWHPHVIPLPSTMSLQLTENDELIILANAAFWACISHEEAVAYARHISDAKMAASKLRDMALAYGTKEEISIIVIYLNSSRSASRYIISTSDGEDESSPSLHSGGKLKRSSTTKVSRPKTFHGEANIPDFVSTTSLSRTKVPATTHVENPLIKSKQSASVTHLYSKPAAQVKQQPQVIATPSPNDSYINVVMDTTVQDEVKKKPLVAEVKKAPLEAEVKVKPLEQNSGEWDTDIENIDFGFNAQHDQALSTVLESNPPIKQAPSVLSQFKASQTNQMKYTPHNPQPSHDFQSLSHSSSFSTVADQETSEAQSLNESANPTWFESLPPVQLGDSYGADTFGLELGMITEAMLSSTDTNVVLGKRDVDQDWGMRTTSYTAPQSSMNTDREQVKANFNFDELMAGLDNAWMTSIPSLPDNNNFTTDYTPATKSTMPREDSMFLDNSTLMEQFDQPVDDKELNDLITQLSEFVNDTS